jgi:hypothetical protein
MVCPSPKQLSVRPEEGGASVSGGFGVRKTGVFKGLCDISGVKGIFAEAENGLAKGVTVMA